MEQKEHFIGSQETWILVPEGPWTSWMISLLGTLYSLFAT